MTNHKNNIDDLQLHAYIDGELDAEIRVEVDGWLANNPKDAEKVRRFQAQNAALHNQFDAILDEAVPETLSALLAAPHGKAAAPWVRIAAAMALLITGGVGGWAANEMTAPNRTETAALIKQAVGAHLVYVSEVRHPVEVEATQETHLVKWLSKRLGKKIGAPDMAAVGFQLIGGRLLPDEGRPAAQFMYEDQGGRRVTLYVRTDGGADTAFKYTADNGASAFYWIDGDLGYALIGNVPRSMLLQLARIAYESL